MKKVTVSIITNNNAEYLSACLGSLIKQRFPSIKIILTDNNSTDNSLEVAKDIFHQNSFSDYQTISNKSNVGFTVAHNKAIDLSKGDYVLILNPDIILDEYFISRLVEYMDSQDMVGAVGGKLLKWDFNQDKKTDIIDSAGLEIYKNHRVIERGGGASSKNYREPEEVFGISGAAILFNKQALKNICYHGEYFDERFFAYKEDIDICFRIRLAGYRIQYLPEAIAWHDRWETGSKRHESDKAVRAKRERKSKIINYLSYRNHLLWLLSDEFVSNLIIYSPWIILYELKKLLFLLFKERSSLRGLYDCIRYSPLTLRKRHAIFIRRKIKAKDIRRWIK